MTSQYKNFMKLLEKWPIDPTKKGRDLGEHIRVCIKAAFNTELGFVGDARTCDQKFSSLNRIISNQNGNLYKREKSNSATGLTAQECNILLSSDALVYLEEENKKGIFDKIQKTFKK